MFILSQTDKRARGNSKAPDRARKKQLIDQMQLSRGIMRVISAGMTVLFIVWAYYQHNDVDPVLWVSVYTLAALLSTLFVFDKLPSPVAMTFGAGCLAGAMYLFSQVEFGPALITIEAWREAVGLIIISTWMGVILLAQKRAQSPTPQTTP